MSATEATATQSAAAVDELATAARAARVAARQLARCSGADRRTALETMAASLEGSGLPGLKVLPRQERQSPDDSVAASASKPPPANRARC